MTQQEKSKIIHEALFPNECWFVAKEQPVEMPNHYWNPNCARCGTLHSNFDYFAPDLPDNIRVKLVTAAEDKFSVFVDDVVWEQMGIDDYKIGGDVYYGPMSVPVATIAEAIYALIKEAQRDDV